MSPAVSALTIGISAILASLVIIWRVARAMAAAIDFFTKHPADHRRLAEVTEANTQALRVLTETVNRLDQSERRRRR